MENEGRDSKEREVVRTRLRSSMVRYKRIDDEVCTQAPEGALL